MNLVKENFHQARWNEPIIHEKSVPNTRGIIPPKASDQLIESIGGNVEKLIPDSIRRKTPPKLPELSQKGVLMHYLRLSQETMGSNLSHDISEGTCTMKYNPRVNEDLVSERNFAYLHPEQDTSTTQGFLEIYYKFQDVVKAVSGFNHFTLQPGGGTHAVFTAASIVRKYWEEKGELDKRNEIITTIFSHPSDAAGPGTAGFKVITIYPDENGIPDIEALKSVVSEKTAAIFMTNPEDIGIFNSKVDEFVKIVHDVGALAFYDQANANAFLGVARAKEAGFDMCHFNVHKTFGTPHACSGPGTGALGCTDELADYLPVPTVDYDGDKYYLNFDHPKSIGKIRDFVGCAGVILRAYAWSRMMGPEGLRECADVSVINNNYMEKKMLAIKGITSAFQDNGITRQEQIRYSLEELKKETGIGSNEFNQRIIDYGIPSVWQSHHPWVIPEPITLEPCETYSKRDIDEYVASVERVVEEAYNNPEIIQTAPHKSAGHQRNNTEDLTDADKWATTWRAYVKKHRK